MKSILLDCSPKKKGSTSSYLLWNLKLQLPGKKIKIKLLPKNYELICQYLGDVNNLILATPIYVDGIPASVLKFFEYVENYVKEKSLNVKVYALVNCGFYEGKQTKSALSMISNWCEKCSFSFCGGIGQGAGEMIGVIRYVNPFLAVLISLILFIVECVKLKNNFSFGQALANTNWINAIVNIALFFVFNTFMYISIFRLGGKIRKGKPCGIIYSTVFCPKFLFVIFADIFWIIKALFRGKTVFSLYKKR